MDKKCDKWKKAICPFSGEKLTDKMSIDEMARSLQVGKIFRTQFTVNECGIVCTFFRKMLE